MLTVHGRRLTVGLAPIRGLSVVELSGSPTGRACLDSLKNTPSQEVVPMQKAPTPSVCAETNEGRVAQLSVRSLSSTSPGQWERNVTAVVDFVTWDIR